eukprot:g7188.t1
MVMRRARHIVQCQFRSGSLLIRGRDKVRHQTTSTPQPEKPKTAKNVIFGTTLFTMVSSVYGYTIWSMQKGVTEDLEALDSEDVDIESSSSSIKKQ